MVLRMFLSTTLIISRRRGVYNINNINAASVSIYWNTHSFSISPTQRDGWVGGAQVSAACCFQPTVPRWQSVKQGPLYCVAVVLVASVFIDNYIEEGFTPPPFEVLLTNSCEHGKYTTIDICGWHRHKSSSCWFQWFIDSNTWMLSVTHQFCGIAMLFLFYL